MRPDKRFQVVAHEVKKLAASANQASQEVVVIIQQMEHVVTGVTQAAHSGYQKASQLEGVIQQAGEVINALSLVAEQSQQQASAITEASHRMQTATEHIRHSTQQQHVTNTQIMYALEGLTQVAQQNADGSHLVSAASSNLESVSQRLNSSFDGN